MVEFFKKNLIKILMIGGLIFCEILAFIQLILQMPEGNILGMIGAYGFFVPFSIGLYLLGNKIKKTRLLKVLLKLIAIVILVVILIHAIKLAFGI